MAAKLRRVIIAARFKASRPHQPTPQKSHPPAGLGRRRAPRRLNPRKSSSRNPVNIALANSWIVINAGGGPTDDKPTVILETPRDPNRVSSFLNIRVKDIDAVYAEWSARGAQFLTPPKQHEYEKRCYIRDPDGHLIEVGQTTDPEGDWSPAHWPSSTPAEESE